MLCSRNLIIWRSPNYIYRMEEEDLDYLLKVVVIGICRLKQEILEWGRRT